MNGDIDRDDVAMRHFGVRCQCVRTNLPKNCQMRPSTAAEVLQFGDQVDTSRWMHVGTSPAATRAKQINSRQINQNNMKESFVGGYMFQ